MRQVGKMPKLIALELPAQITDHGIAHLGELRGLQKLTLADGVGDQGLKHLTKLTNLLQVDLFKTRVTDAGLVHLSNANVASFEIPHLVTDEGLKHLVHMENLYSIRLGSGVSDAGIVHLKKFARLKYLMIPSDSKITAVGLEDLKRTFPKLTIHVVPPYKATLME
jgi:hypothetical protein